MKNIIRNMVFAATLVCCSTACKQTLEQVNINPNGASSDTRVTPDQLLPSGQKSMFVQYSGYVGQITQQIAQHLSKVVGADQDRYILPNTSVSNMWLAAFSENLPDIGLVRKYAGTNSNYTSVGEIMECWVYSLLTDYYGDIPYSEAIKGLHNYTSLNMKRRKASIQIS